MKRHRHEWVLLGKAKVLCILHHWGVQLILAYSWARPGILAAGKGRGGMFLFLLFLHFHSFSSFSPVPLFHLLDYAFYLSSLFLWEKTKWPTRVDVLLNPNTQSRIICRMKGVDSETCIISKVKDKDTQAWIIYKMKGENSETCIIHRVNSEDWGKNIYRMKGEGWDMNNL